MNFVDILQPRREKKDVFTMMTKDWNPQKSQVMERYCSPQDLKFKTIDSVYIDAILEMESTRQCVSKEKLRSLVFDYLEEMGLDKKLYVIRWMGVIFLKISLMMKIQVFVNESAIFQLKTTMGKNQVLFLPTHRSYADFCLMTYLCFHYDIDFPAVAAAMDFYHMAVLGKRLRESCAFYIRRTLAGAPLYAATLKQYVRTLVTNHCAPIEFFIEGTRSRSNKSLPPKYGMLSMALMPFFTAEVTDITIVPINISYDRIMEQALFAFEHLGVPKPKESTGGFLKAIKTLNDNFGNIYVNMGVPLSLREYLHNFKITSESLKPVDLQQMTEEQFSSVQDVANHVVNLQQKSTVVSISNLLALAVMKSVINNCALLRSDIDKEIQWLASVLRKLGATVFENDLNESINRILQIHKKVVFVDKGGIVRVMRMDFLEVNDCTKKKMKGHILSTETMKYAVPIIQLQLYVNPVLFYTIPASIVSVLIAMESQNKDKLMKNYFNIRMLMKYEFYYLEKDEHDVFARALEFCIENDAISQKDGKYILGGCKELQYFLKWLIWPTFDAIINCMDVLSSIGEVDHGTVLRLTQEKIEGNGCHPYCLSLDVIANCLQGLLAVGAIVMHRRNEVQIYKKEAQVFEKYKNLVGSVLSKIELKFDKNSVILDHYDIPSRL